MKKIKVIFTSVVSAIVCLQLVGYFNVVKIFAAEDFTQAPPQEFSINSTNPSDAQEEGAADILDNQDFSGDSELLEEDSKVTEEAQLPQVKSFAPTVSSAPTMEELSLPPVPNVVINEFMAKDAEWVELYNNDNQPADISNWKIGDSLNPGLFTVPADTTVTAKGFILFTRTFNLNDTGDTVNLSTSDMGLVDSHSYASTHSGKSFGRYPDGTNNWYELNDPTPGTANYMKPIAGTVRDGVSASLDIDYSNDNTSLSANWSGFSDPIYPIDHYEYAFGTTSGDTDVTGGWLNTSETYASFAALLVENQTYYASVKAINSESVASDIVTSDGVTIDLTAPVNMGYTIDSKDGSPITVGSEVYVDVQPGEAGLKVEGTFNSKTLIWEMGIDQLKHGPYYYATYVVEKSDLQTDNAKLSFAFEDMAGNFSQVYEFDSNIQIDTVAPTAPASISVISGSDNVQINWEASDSEDVIGYNIYRSSSPYVKLNQDLLPKDQTSYTDKDVEEGVTYHYKITAVDAAGNETLLDDAIESQAIEITAVSKVVGQILDEGVKTYEPQTSGFVSKAYAAESKVEGEKSVETNDQDEATTEEASATNWPLIIALIVAGLIVLSGIWYYWVVTRNMEENSSQPVRVRRSRRTSRNRSRAQSRKPRSRRSRRGR